MPAGLGQVVAIAAGWSSEDVNFAGGVGSQMTPGFPGRAPMPIELRVEKADEDGVRWASVGQFPPHWVDTEIIWTFGTNDDGGTSSAVRAGAG